MPTIEAVFFWLGGVLTETIPEAVARLLYQRPLAKLPIDDRLLMRQLVDSLYIGETSALSFLERMIEQSTISYHSQRLATEIQATTPLRDGVLAIVDALPATCDRWLLFDYPAEWSQVLGSRLGLATRFSADQILYLTRSGLHQLVPDVFYYLVRQAGKHLDNCLVIDSNSARAVQGIRHRLQSTIYVDVGRLRRDLVLRRLLPQPAGFVMPGPRP